MARSITTFLMFEGMAEEAMTLYVSVFRASTVRRVERWTAGEQGRTGSIKRAEFSVGGHEIIALDSPIAHEFTFTPAMSLFVECEEEAELDAVYAQLSAGGQVADAARQLRLQPQVRLAERPLRRLLAAQPGLIAGLGAPVNPAIANPMYCLAIPRGMRV